MAKVMIEKDDGSTLDWVVTESQADHVVAMLFGEAPKRAYRQTKEHPLKRGPKPQADLDLEKALRLRAYGIGTEAIAKALGVPRTTLRNALERHDHEQRSNHGQ